jgi:hypothetical protein
MNEDEKTFMPPKKTSNGKRFGYEQPAIAGPGRPRLPEGEKERRKYLRNIIQQATPKAIQVLVESLEAKQTKDRIRAAEILTNHSLPKQEEVELDGRISPLSSVPEPILTKILADAIATGSPTPPHNGNGGNGAKA